MIFYETLIQSSGPTHSQLARARIALCAHENFRKKKCVSIDLKCFETHRNEKKITPYEWHFPLPQNGQIFQKKKKKCVSIDPKCSETHRNEKKNYAL